MIGQVSPRELIALLRPEFHSPDTGAGVPAYNAEEGRLYWDITNDNLYANMDGTNNWQLIGGGGGIGGGGAATQVTYWTGALTIAGDAGFTYNAATDTITLAGGITLTGGANSVITVNDNVANALTIVDAGATEYMRIISTDAQPIVRWNDGGADVDFYVEAVGVADAFVIQGSDGQCTIGALATGYVYATAGVLSVVDPIPLTDLGSYTQGDIIYGGAADWQDLAISGNNYDILGVNAAGTEPEWQTFDWDNHVITAGGDGVHTHQNNPEGGVLAGAAFPHAILDGVAHTDSAADAVTRGSLIYGNATPLWDELNHPGGANRVLTTDANDVLWSAQSLTLTTSLTNQGANGVLNWSGAFTLTIPATGTCVLGGGSGVNTRVAYWTDANTLSSDAGMTYDAATDSFYLLSSTSARPVLEIQNTNADALCGTIDFYKNTASPADNDDLGAIDFYGETSTGALERYAYILAESGDVTNGDTGGRILINVVMDSTERNMLRVDGYWAGVNQGAILFNEDAQDVDFSVRAVGVADALVVQGSDGQITLGVLGAGLVQSTAGGVLSSSYTIGASITADDYFTNDGGTFGIAANELLTVNAAGTFAFSGISGVSVEDGDWIGAGSGCAWLYDSSNGDITTTVNVGIGTTSPDYEFELEMNLAATLSLNVQNLNNAQISRVMIQNDGGSVKSSDYRIYGSASAATLAGIAVADWAVLVQQSNLSGFMIYNTSTDPIVFCTNATERMRVDGTTGYVGIGDTTPDATLDVSETDAVTNAITDIAILEHLTSGTAAANFGAGLLYQLEDAGGTSRNAMRQAVVWQSAAAAENAEFQLYLNYNGTLYDCGVLVGPGAASFAGNQRGIGAVDWQGYRSAAADVASGAYSVISGGAYNAATQSYSAALSGYDNLAAAQYSIVCGGSGNSANPGTGYAFTGGGLSNTASGDYATVGGGDTNTSSGSHAAICGGDTNTASGTASTVGGGISNLASNLYATIPGGYSCIASGSVSYAGGYDAHATHDYSMVFSATNANTVSWAASTFTARCHGGARFYSAAGVGTGVQLAAGASAWAAISDRATKENFVPVGAEILDLVLALPLYNYNLKSQDESIRHIGPVAQDFNSIFGFTEAELYINTFDATGVALAAAKQLILENRELRSRIANLEALWQHSH